VQPDDEMRPEEQESPETAPANDDPPAWLSDLDDTSRGASTRGFQFGLLSLFGLMTVSAVYVFLEKRHEGQFGLHFVAGAVLWFGIALPAVALVLWIYRLVVDATPPMVGILLAMALAVAIGFGLTRLPGF
jgi:hypothetical protein